MRVEDIIRYESGNINTIALYTNKSVCRGYEVSAYWLASYLFFEKIYRKRSRCQNAELLYVWFHTSMLAKVLEELYANGFRPISRNSNQIILKNENQLSNDFKNWRKKTIQRMSKGSDSEAGSGKPTVSGERASSFYFM